MRQRGIIRLFPGAGAPIGVVFVYLFYSHASFMEWALGPDPTFGGGIPAVGAELAVCSLLSAEAR